MCVCVCVCVCMCMDVEVKVICTYFSGEGISEPVPVSIPNFYCI